MKMTQNSELSMEGKFKYAISKKSIKNKYNGSGKINWMPESNVRLTMQEENGNRVMVLEIQRIKNQKFRLTQQNLCGLETGRIITPMKLTSCFFKNDHPKSSPYLLIVVEDNTQSQMILLLHTNVDDDQVTKQWKWSIQNKLAFGKSWPNLQLEYSNDRRSKISSERATVMLGRTWVAFFKYTQDSLPNFWKRFHMDDIDELRLLDSLSSDGDRKRCLIRFQSCQAGSNMGSETFTIHSGRSEEILQFIESYKNSPCRSQLDLHNIARRSMYDPTTESTTDTTSTTYPNTLSTHAHSSSEITASDHSTTDDSDPMIPIYPVKDVHRLSLRLRRFNTPMQDIYIHPSVKHSDKECGQMIPTGQVLLQNNYSEPPPSPCGVSSSKVHRMDIKDFGYIDRPYIPMHNQAIGLKSKNLSTISTYDPFSLLQFKLDYITLPVDISYTDDTETVCSVVNRGESFKHDPFHIIPKPQFILRKRNYSVFPKMPTLYSVAENVSVVDAEVMTDPYYVPPSMLEWQMPHNSSANDSNLRFDLDLATGVSNNCEVDRKPQYKHIPPPSPHMLKPKRMKRSLSENEVSPNMPVDDFSLFRKKMQQWSTTKNFTLPKDVGELVKENILRINAKNSAEVNTSEVFYSSVDNEDDSIHDLNELTFPLTHLDADEKEEIFHWMESIMKSERMQSTALKSVPDTGPDDSATSHALSSYDDDQYRHGVRMRRSISQTDIPRKLAKERKTSSVIYGYWSATNICRTIDKVIRHKPPFPDTLGLTRPIRKELCLRLYTNSHLDAGKHDWEALADVIGLKEDCVSVIQCCLHNQPLKLTAAEIVLRHWQFIYNKYWKNDERDTIKCPLPCTKDTLIHLLKYQLERLDLVELVTNDKREQKNYNIQYEIASSTPDNEPETVPKKLITQQLTAAVHSQSLNALNDLNKPSCDSESVTLNRSYSNKRKIGARRGNSIHQLEGLKVGGQYHGLEEFQQKSYV